MSLTAQDLLAARIEDLLDQRRMNQAELATRSALSQPMVSQILAGKRRVSLDTLDQLAQALRVSVSALFEDPASPGSVALTAEETALVRAFRTADTRTQAAVCMLLGVPMSDALAEVLPHVPTAPVPVDLAPPDARQRIISLVADLGEAVKRLADAGSETDRSAAGGAHADRQTPGA